MLLLPDCIRIQLLHRLTALDVLIEDGGYIGFGNLRVPGAVRIDHDGRSLLAGAETGRAAHENVCRHHAALHHAHVKRHQQLCGALAPARWFGMTGRAGVGTNDDVIFRFWHANSFVQSSDQPSAVSCLLTVEDMWIADY